MSSSSSRRASRRPARVAKEGFLTKQGHLVKNWKLRWFVLRDDGNLEYYATPGDKTPKGRLKIVKGMTIDVNDVPKVKPNCFILQSKKPFLLSAETHDSRQSWIRALNNAIYGIPQDVSAPLEDPKPAASPAASPSASGTTLAPPPTLSSPSLEFISLQPVLSPPPHLSKPSTQFISKPPFSAAAASPVRVDSPPPPSAAPSADSPSRVNPSHPSADTSAARWTSPKAQRAPQATPFGTTNRVPSPGKDSSPDAEITFSTEEVVPVIADTAVVSSLSSSSSSSASVAVDGPAIISPSSPVSSPSPPPSQIASSSIPSSSIPSFSIASPNPSSQSSSSSRQSGGATQMQRVAEFQLGEVLGKGAFGVVYRGLSVSTGEMVAVKQIPLKEISAKELAALVSEVSLLSSLQHDNVVRLIRSVRTPETLNIIMEFIEGGSLLDVIKKFGGSVPETLLRSYVAQMLSGLAYLHQKGVLHRDIKAANLLITKAGQVKMADFGIAALDTDKSAPEHSFAGSPYWLAPEVILLEKARPQSDVWSMGCTILELLTGSPPYYHLNPLAAMHAMADDAKQVPVPSEACSPALQDFLAKCFTYDVAKRPTAQQLLQHAFVTGREYVPEQSSPAPAAAPVVVAGEVENQAVEAEDEDTEEEASESDLFSSEINACREICTWLTRALDKQRVKESHQLYEGLLPRAKSFLRAIKNKQNAKAETFKKVLIAVLDRYNREIEGAVEGFGKYDSGSESDSASHSVSSDGSETGSFDSDGEDTDDLFRGSTFSLNNI